MTRCVLQGRRGVEEECNQQLHKVSLCLRNQCGLLFTNETKENVLEYFTQLAEPDFARTGGIAQETVTLKEGPLPEFSHSMEPQLRQLGLPTSLAKGVVTLVKDHVVCTEGDTLSSEQARILKLLGHMQAEFRLRLTGVWSNDGTFEVINESTEVEENGQIEEEGGDMEEEEQSEGEEEQSEKEEE